MKLELKISDAKRALVGVLAVKGNLPEAELQSAALTLLGTPNGSVAIALDTLADDGIVVRRRQHAQLAEGVPLGWLLRVCHGLKLIEWLESDEELMAHWRAIKGNHYWSGKHFEEEWIRWRLRAAFLSGNVPAYRDLVQEGEGKGTAWKGKWSELVAANWNDLFGFSAAIPDGLDPLFIPEVFAPVAARAILQNAPASSIIESLRALAGRQDEIPSDSFAPFLLAALYTWRGEKDTLYAWMNQTGEDEPFTLFNRLDQGAFAVFLKGCIAFTEGNWSAADESFSEIESLVLRPFRLAPLPWQCLPVLFLFFLTNLKSKRNKFRTTFLYDLLQTFCDGPRTERLRLFTAYFTKSAEEGFVGFSQAPDILPETPVEAMFCGWFFSRLPKTAPLDDIARRCLQLAENALENGYALAAIQILGGIAWRESVRPKAKPLLERLVDDEDRGVPIWIVSAPMESWEQALAELDTIVAEETDRIRKAKAKKTEVVSWWVAFRPSPSGKPNLEVASLQPRIQKRAAGGALKGGRTIALKSFYEGKYNDLLVDQDRAMRSCLVKRYTAKGMEDFALPLESIVHLAGHPSVFRVDSPDDKTGEPIRIVRGELQVGADKQDDDSFVLDIPFSKTATTIVRPDADGAYCVYEISDEMRRLRAIAEKYAPDGKIRIPSGGQEQLQGLLRKMAARYRVVGHSEALGAVSDVTNVFEEPTLCLQLFLRRDVLELTLRIRPFPEENLIVEPGRGVEQSLKMHKNKQVLFIRALAEEMRVAQQFVHAVPDLEPWATGDYSWRIDNLSSALAILPQLRQTNPPVTLTWPEGEKLSVATVKANNLVQGSQTSLDRWLSVKGTFTLDTGKVLQFAELLSKLSSRTGNFVRLSETQYLQLTHSMLRRLEALQVAGTVKGDELLVSPSAVPMLSASFPDDRELALPDHLKARAELFRRNSDVKPEIPPHLRCTLRTYQEDGFVWMARLTSCGLGVCLADDMGLGKTVQILALLLSRADEGPSLVVAPASVCLNWVSEMTRFTPTLRPRLLAASDGERGAKKKFGPHDVVVCSYGLLVSREDSLAAVSWNGVVLDEAQAIKNFSSKRKKCADRLTSRFRVAATGTPVENRLLELWSLFDFLNPGLLGTHQAFVSTYADNRIPRSLKRLVSPLLLRRLKSEVLEELPPKTEVTLQVQLSEDERAAYESCRLEALELLNGEERKDNRIYILSQLTRLRRFCCHPTLLFPDFQGTSAKMEALGELVESLRDNGHRALIFSQFVDFLAIVRAEFDRQGISYHYLDGSTPTDERMRQVESFQNGAGDFFLISLKAGGTGLNLTAANYVILLDPWWNPAVENQAADRVYRMGQKNPVTVYRLVAADTVEERVLELHETKKALAEELLEGADNTAISTESLMGLFKK